MLYLCHLSQGKTQLLYPEPYTVFPSDLLVPEGTGRSAGETESKTGDEEQ